MRTIVWSVHGSGDQIMESSKQVKFYWKVSYVVSDVVEKTSTRRRSRIPCVVVEKITTRRREGVGDVVEKNEKVDELSTKIRVIYLQQ